MPRASGSKNKATIAKEQAARLKIIEEYEAEKKANAAKKPPESGESCKPPCAGADAETLDLEAADDALNPPLDELMFADSVGSESQPDIPEDDSEDDSEEILNLEPPPNPLKEKKESRQERDRKSPVDKRQPASKTSSHKFTPRQKEPPAQTRRNPLGGVFRR